MSKSTPKKTNSLPSAHQAMSIACAMAEGSLSIAVKQCLAVEEWVESNANVVNATELALVAVQLLATQLPMSEEDFSVHWARIGGAMNLAAKAYPKGSTASVCLDSAATEIEQLHNVVLYACEKETEHEL